jgi:phosphonatase-like hydrolase
MIELAVMDLAGTLVRDDGAVEGAFLDALQAVGAVDGARLDPELAAVVRKTMGRSKIVVFREMLGDERRATDANAAFESAYEVRIARGETAALPLAENTLDACRAMGVKVAITTGFSPRTRDQLLGSLGWESRIDLALSPNEELRGRPAPDLVLAAVLRLRVDDVRSVAVVGDTTNDLLSGYRAGASVLVGVLSGAHDREALEAAPHTHIVDGVGQLPGVIRSAQPVSV